MRPALAAEVCYDAARTLVALTTLLPTNSTFISGKIDPKTICGKLSIRRSLADLRNTGSSRREYSSA